MPVKFLLGFDPPKKSRAVHVFTSPRFFHIKLASILFLPVIILNYYYRSSINESEEKIPRLGCLQ